MTFPKYLSVKQVAEILGVDEKTIYKYADETPRHLRYDSINLFDAEKLYKGSQTRSPKKDSF